MSTTDFESLFPLKGEITPAILQKADRRDTKRCVGARTLRAALGEQFATYFSGKGGAEVLHDPEADYFGWGAYCGNVRTRQGGEYLIGTEEGLQMMEVTEPQAVTFIISKRYHVV